MEISTNSTQTTNTYNQTKQKEASFSNGSFQQYMNMQSQKDPQTQNTTSSKEDYIEVNDSIEQTQDIVYTQDVAKSQIESNDTNGKFLNLLDNYMPNYFEENGISKEDEEVMRVVLSDDSVSESEAISLSFDQAKYVQKVRFDLLDYGTENNLPAMWLGVEGDFTQSILGITSFPTDETFARAIHKTILENFTSHDYELILQELSHTLKQAFVGMDLGFNMSQAPAPFGLHHELEPEGFDYEEHMLKLLGHVDTLLRKPSVPEIRKEYERMQVIYGKILENYQDLKNEEQ